MQRSLIRILAAGTILAALAACGGASRKAGAETGQTAAETATGAAAGTGAAAKKTDGAAGTADGETTATGTGTAAGMMDGATAGTGTAAEKTDGAAAGADALRGKASAQSNAKSLAQAGKRKPFRGRIIAVSDSVLMHGSTDTLRFGRLGSGEIAVLRFQLENASAKPLVILSTQRSCGCISLDHDAQPIAPGQARTLEMTFDSRGEYGWQLKRMDLILAGARKPLRIFVEADIE